MFSQIANQQQQQQQSEASNQLRLLKRSIESNQHEQQQQQQQPLMNTSNKLAHHQNKKRLNKHRLDTPTITTTATAHQKSNKLHKTTNNINNNNSTPHRSRQVPHRSTLSTRLSSSSSTRHPRPSRIIGTHSHSESAIDVLRKLLQSRWDPVTKLLDLANLAQDKILKAAGIAAPGQKGAPLRTAGAIWKLCKEICPNVRSISLAENQLQSLQPMSISSLVATFPELANLSLAGNRLGSFFDLNALSPTTGRGGIMNGCSSGLTSLRELILTGNPLRTHAEKDGQTGLQNYLFEVVRRFPSLEVLDGEAIDPAMKATIAATVAAAPNRSQSMVEEDMMPKQLDTLPPQPPLPMSIQPAFMNDSSTSTFVAAFCLQFFNAFDHDRASLMDVYATQSSFSLCASPYIPARAKMAGLTRNSPDMPAQQVPSWNEYIAISRNNARLKGPKLSERLANGPAEIVNFMKQIPGTKHPINGSEDGTKFVVDSWQMGGLVNENVSVGGSVIYVSIHGQFQELPSLTVRSFDRNFLLGAAGPASAAALKGWPCVILTDQLTVRGYSSPQAWAPTATTSITPPQPHASAPVIPLPSTTNNGLAQPPKPLIMSEEEKKELIKKVMDLTNLNLNFTLDCLTQNHWNFEASIKNFHEILQRGGLPPDAFLSSSSS
ncbi:nuclear mRNA export, poly(A)+RNA binding protein [Puccinia graminis f. sp. tritici]|uniref:Nuclear mRNA export, poly(A)+RNA binding protein n=1 Tax=Puccinia graminis f. sp. tritici TaxID=56615 RepID=A0A5B0SA21_PUCGR|nr:nuclear mRNA export, poly(A)+RNA binding protein [Puccinia graminis f. sp. tritici]KAA1134662.1 nuclear mRNA export, poly(A)+RNA binding protein [Puccinia graminis f. sp. tritici]